jgi:hypothetical protein
VVLVAWARTVRGVRRRRRRARSLGAPGSPRHGHPLVAVGALELKGLAEAVTTYEVPWTPLPTRGDERVPLPAGLPIDREFRFVGREEELGRLMEHWSSAEVGERRLTLVGGGPRIGKTRLATEVARAVGDGGAAFFGVERLCERTFRTV